jgi:hypothetical protein
MSGKSVLAQTGPKSVNSGRGGFVSFQLSSKGIHKLDRAHHHHLPVKVTVRNSSGATATSQLDLVRFTVRGKGPSRRLSQSPTVQIIGTTQFVSRSGVAAVLAACYAGGHPCHLSGGISASGRSIGRLDSGHVGIHELGFVYINLNKHGRSMLAHSSDNQLPAKVKLTDGRQTAKGHVALTTYS